MPETPDPPPAKPGRASEATQREEGTSPAQQETAEKTRVVSAAEARSEELQSTPSSGSLGSAPASVEAASTALPQGLADRYRLVRVLGKGGFANVYLAHDSVLDQDVAIKILKLGLASKSEQDRFLFEARIGAKLRHPNIITVLDIIQAPDGLQMIMEYCPGGNLSERIKKKGAMKPRQAIDIMRQVAQALSYAHRRNYVHRDVKPANIFLTTEGYVKLGDFGIAAFTDMHEFTQTGMIIGTPLYMAPEQATDSRDVDPRADIYSLGLTLYTMLTGVSPRVLDMERVPPAFRGLIRHATQLDRNDRLVSGDQFVAKLDQIQEQLSGGADADAKARDAAPAGEGDPAPATPAAGRPNAGENTQLGDPATELEFAAPATPATPTPATPTTTKGQTTAQPALPHVPPHRPVVRWVLNLAQIVLGFAIVIIALKYLDVIPSNSRRSPRGENAGGPDGGRGGFRRGEDSKSTRTQAVASGNGASKSPAIEASAPKAAATATPIPTPDPNNATGDQRGPGFRRGEFGERRGDRRPPFQGVRDGIANRAGGGAVAAQGATSSARTQIAATPAPPAGLALTSVAGTLASLRSDPRNPLYKAVNVLDDAVKLRKASSPMADHYMGEAIASIQLIVNRNDAVANDPLASLLMGIASIRLNMSQEIYSAHLLEAYRLNQASPRKYDLNPDQLQKDLELTDSETAQLRQASDLATRGRRGGRGGDGMGPRGAGRGFPQRGQGQPAPPPAAPVAK